MEMINGAMTTSIIADTLTTNDYGGSPSDLKAIIEIDFF